VAVVEHFCPLCVVLSPIAPFVLHTPLPLKIDPVGTNPPTLRITALNLNAKGKFKTFSKKKSIKKLTSKLSSLLAKTNQMVRAEQTTTRTAGISH